MLHELPWEEMKEKERKKKKLEARLGQKNREDRDIK